MVQRSAAIPNRFSALPWQIFVLSASLMGALANSYAAITANRLSRQKP